MLLLFTERILTGGEHLERKEALGEIVAEMKLTVMIVVNVTTAVVIAVKETAGMTVNIEVRQENMMKVGRARFNDHQELIRNTS